MSPVSFYIGKKNLSNKLFKIINKKIDKSIQYNVLIGHAKALNDGEKIKLLFKSKSDIFKKVRLIELGGALGVHTGPGSISVALQKIDD